MGMGVPRATQREGDTWGTPATLSGVGGARRERGSALTVSVLCGTGGTDGGSPPRQGRWRRAQPGDEGEMTREVPKVLGVWEDTPSDPHVLHLLLQHLLTSPPRLLLAPPFLLLLLLLGELLLDGRGLHKGNQLSQVCRDKGAPLSPPAPHPAKEQGTARGTRESHLGA